MNFQSVRTFCMRSFCPRKFNVILMRSLLGKLCSWELFIQETLCSMIVRFRDAVIILSVIIIIYSQLISIIKSRYDCNWDSCFLFTAIHSDQWCTASVSSIAPIEPVGAAESQLLSSWFWPDLHWLCTEAVWIHWRRTDSVRLFYSFLYGVVKLQSIYSFCIFNVGSFIP